MSPRRDLDSTKDRAARGLQAATNMAAANHFEPIVNCGATMWPKVSLSEHFEPIVIDPASIGSKCTALPGPPQPRCSR